MFQPPSCGLCEGCLRQTWSALSWLQHCHSNNFITKPHTAQGNTLKRMYTTPLQTRPHYDVYKWLIKSKLPFLPILLLAYTLPVGAGWGQSRNRHLKSVGSAPSITLVTLVSEGYSFFFRKPTAFLMASDFSLEDARLPIHTHAPASPLSMMNESCGASNSLHFLPFTLLGKLEKKRRNYNMTWLCSLASKLNIKSTTISLISINFPYNNKYK